MKNEWYLKNKWYLQTWFICLLFSLWFLIIPGIIGLILLILQIIENNKRKQKYGKYDELDSKISDMENNYEERCRLLDEQYKMQSAQFEKEIESKKELLASLISQKNSLNKELDTLKLDVLCEHYNFSDYSGLTSEECKNKLSLLKLNEKEAIKNKSYFYITSDNSKKSINDNVKQLIRCFNAECDNILLGLSAKNIDTARNKVTKSFETLNKIFFVDGIQLAKLALEHKLEELNLVYSYELKRAQEIATQKEIKAQMLEEEKVRREIEKQKAKIQKDQIQFNNEINKLMKYMQKTSDDIEKKLYIDKIRELENKLKELEKEKETVLEREANAKAGFVYIISNIGSFGEDIYKIGMTRRLEPMDRIKELSSASVPFEFDVHAMIFSDNAPELENMLHKHFEKQSVNKVNLKKEFFHVSLDEIENVVKSQYNNTVEFTKIPVASEYRQTLSLMESGNF